jgi:hypothetical protein
LALRLIAYAVRLGMSLDTNDRQNDDGCRLVRITAEADNASLVRELYDRAHQPLSPAAGQSVMLQSAKRPTAIKRCARLTVC